MEVRKASSKALEVLRKGILYLHIFLYLVWKSSLSWWTKQHKKVFCRGTRFANREGEEVQITHLLFADDTLVFYKDSKDQMAYLSWILLWFEALLGLKINLDKSSVLTVGNVDDIEGLAMELGCSDTPSPLTSSRCAGHSTEIPSHFL